MVSQMLQCAGILQRILCKLPRILTMAFCTPHSYNHNPHLVTCERLLGHPTASRLERGGDVQYATSDMPVKR